MEFNIKDRTAKDYHFQLAEYYRKEKPLYLDGENYKKPNVRKLVEQPWQELEAAKATEKQFEKEPKIKEEREKRWDNVTNTLCNLDFIQAKAAAKLTYDLVDEVNNALEVIPDNAEEIAKEKSRQAHMEKYPQDLIACAEGKISRFDLEVPESITPWTEEQINVEVERIKTNPNRADKLKDFRNFLGQEAGILQNDAFKFPFLGHQQAWNYSSDGFVGRMAENVSQSDNYVLLRRNSNTRLPWNPKPMIIQKMNIHTSRVHAIAVTPDGKYAISGSYDHTCIFWDLKNGNVVKILRGHTNYVWSVSITPDGTYAISCSMDHTAIVWDLKKGTKKKTLLLDDRDKYTWSDSVVSITPDGKQALISDPKNNNIFLWDLYVGKRIKTLTGHSSSVKSISLTPDGKLAISGSLDKTCIIWDLVNGTKKNILAGHYDFVNAVTITPDGKYALSGSADKTCILWDLFSGDKIVTLKGHKDKITCVDITPDRKIAVSGSWDGTCILWDIPNRKRIKTLTGHTETVNTISICSDGTKAISGSWDHTCILWELTFSRNDRSTYTNLFSVSASAITINGNYAFLGSNNNSCVIYDILEGKIVKSFTEHTETVSSISTGPDGNYALSSSFDNICVLWDLQRKLLKNKLIGHTHSVTDVSFTPDGKYALTASWDNTCILWDLTSGKKIKTLIGHAHRVETVSIAPDGKFAITGSSDHTCILWNLVNGEIIKKLKRHTHYVSTVSITHNGKYAISGSEDKTCQLWNLISGKIEKTFKGHTDTITDVSIMPNSKFAITGSWDKTCILWNLTTGQQLAKFTANFTIWTIDFFAKGILIGCRPKGGSDSGELVFIDLKNSILKNDTVIITIRQIWNLELKQYNPLSADCLNCSHHFSPPNMVVRTIEKLTKEANLSSDQSPCLSLPDKAWENPGLLSKCPKCGVKLKFNPFIAGGVVYEEDKVSLFTFHKNNGDFAKAEDVLFDILEERNDEIEILNMGLSFYYTLLKLPDEWLNKGNLPRDEVLQAIKELKSKMMNK